LRGSLRSPELDLSSRPPLDEGDILSLIVFNQPVNSLGAAEQVNLGERAAALAAGAITSPLADSIGRALNLDVFEIQAPTSEQGTGSVMIGSQFGSRLLVGLRQQFGNNDTSLLTLEYRVSDLLRFVTSIASGSLQAHATRPADRSGVDLIFVIRY
jgi:autotransporter translocation and assembly factor TamB